MRHSLIILFCFSFLSIFVAQGQSENEKSMKRTSPIVVAIAMFW